MVNQQMRNDWENESGQRTLVAFQLNGQAYALPVETIVQITPMVTITPLPGLNHSVEGIINVRGAAVPVVNLRRHLSLPEAPLQLHTPIILVRANGHMMGLIVDELTEVLSLPASEVSEMTDILPEWLGEAPVLQGLTRTRENGTTLLLNLDQLGLTQ